MGRKPLNYKTVQIVFYVLEKWETLPVFEWPQIYILIFLALSPRLASGRHFLEHFVAYTWQKGTLEYPFEILLKHLFIITFE